jgi:hypothetical protein
MELMIQQYLQHTGELINTLEVQANRYNEYSGCDRLCHGWEFEKQWAYWTRTSSSWYIGSNSALMQTTSGAVPAENYLYRVSIVT